MIRVLHVLHNLGSGGAESFLMNMYRKIDHNKVQFDFLIRSDQNGPIVDEITSMGGQIFRIADFPRHYFKNIRELKRFLKEHREYQIIHVHANSLMYVKPLQLAKKYGIPCRIIHSHSTQAANFPLLKLIHKYNRKRINRFATHRFACSDKAGDWMFADGDYKIINNGIDLNRFRFDVVQRERIRREYHLKDAFVIGHVGRLSAPKNHVFLLRLFAKLLEQKTNARLMLVGDGELRGSLDKLAGDLGIRDKVIFIGFVENTQDYLSAMDVFVLPSLYEGYPIALVEAQAMGLPCVASASITASIILGSNCKLLSLECGMGDWIETIENVSKGKPDKDKIRALDNQNVANELETFYLNLNATHSSFEDC